jgi:uncharacterized protein (TIRG00374 family)
MQYLPRILLVFGVTLFAILVARVGPEAIISRLSSANVNNILGAILCYFFILAFGCLRLVCLISDKNKNINILKLSQVFFLNCFVSNMTPGRSGDIIAPAMLANQCGLSLPFASAVIILDRFSDFFVLLFVCALSVIWLTSGANDNEMSNIFDDVLGLVYVFFCSIVFMCFIVYFLMKNFTLKRKYENSSFGKITKKGSMIFKNNVSKRNIVVAVMFSLVIWLLHFLKEFLMVSAFIEISFGYNVVCQSIATLVSLFSFVPGGVGVGAVSYAFVAEQLSLDWQGAASAAVIGSILFMSIRMVMGVLFNKHLIVKI